MKLPDDRPVLAIDFDGVLLATRFDCGDERGAVVGAIDALQSLYGLGGRYRIIVHSCRCLSPGGEEDIWAWLHSWGVDHCVHAVTALKPDAVAYVDDKAVAFGGAWDAGVEEAIGRLAGEP